MWKVIRVIDFLEFFFSGNTSKFIECSEQFRQFSDAFVASGKY